VNEHDAIARIKRLSHNINCADEIAEVIERLINERDEARREICGNATKEPYRQMCGSGNLLPQDAARERGWDCYKEDEK
jgi:hypothetical protein